MRASHKFTRAAIEVMQAYLDGAEIETHLYSSWDDLGEEWEWEDIEVPAWDWGVAAYRVKKSDKE